jgi:Mg-chelatase subunit ChlD/HEAT repeat protein
VKIVSSLGCALVLLALGAGHPAQAANDDWPRLQRDFQHGFVIDGLEDGAVRGKARARKRAAVEALAACKDGRAVPLLLDAHHDQQKFLAALEAAWAKRQEAWERLAPSMFASLGAKEKAAGPGNSYPVTQAEKAWLDERNKLATLRLEISREEEIAETIRRAMAKVVEDLEGDERRQAVTHMLAAAGHGRTEVEREFIRLLGRVAGDRVTDALEAYARSFDPFVAQPALVALGRQHAARSVDTLLGRLDDPRWQLRAAALEGLSFYREARIVDALVQRLPGEDGVLRRHYYVALARMLGVNQPATVQAWTSWWKAHRAEVVARWARGEASGPVPDDLPAVALESGNATGSTSFYGLRTESKHIIFVIDVSGSMGEQGGKDEQGHYRIDVAKRELVNAIRSLSAEHGDQRGAASFNIVAYNAQVTVFKPGHMLEATKRNKDRAFAWISKLRADGATNISDALDQAFEIIGTRKRAKQLEEGADTIFLMTDGKPTAGRITDPDLIRESVRKRNRERQITIYTIGVGRDHDARFLRQLAVENGGEYLAR